MLNSELVNQLKRIAQKYDTKIYLVGGPLRDTLLGRKIKDLDIVVEKLIHIIGKDLADSLNGKFQFYENFNTGTITLPGDSSKNGITHIDIAQTRKEIYLRPAALPKVFPADLIADLYRRDFTINAMAQDLDTGELIDPFCGWKDLKKGIIRALHPKSFNDDPTRIFRAIRFALRFNFAIEPETLNWLRTAIRQQLPSLLSGERVLQELRLITQETNWIKILKRLNEEGLFYSLFGEKLSKTFFRYLPKVAKAQDTHLRLIYLLAQFELPNHFPITKQEAIAIRDWQKYPKIRPILKRACRPSAIYKILRNFSLSALRLASLVEEPSYAFKINQYLNKYQRIKICIGGKDIKALGIIPDKIYGKLLAKILLARLDGKVKTRTDEIKLLKKLLVKEKGKGVVN